MLVRQLGETEVLDSLKGQPKVDWGFKAVNIPRLQKVTKGKGVKIAVMDTGIDMNHPEFKDSFKLGINMIERTDDVTDDYGHGSHVAGLITGKNVGVAPEAELYVAKVLDNLGHGSIQNVLDGITFAINCNVDILCISLGIHRKPSNMVIERIRDAYNNGITIVSATGNNLGDVLFPANLPEVIGVGGLDKDYSMAPFTNTGEGLDVLAPAVEILSAYKDGKYARMTGTSMASPIIAGIIALMISRYREQGAELTPAEIKTMLISFLQHNTKI
ncbi:S8 family serine peptidase [Priestia aryabhattai]|uniref:S8 family peptidase n=1 Tax=Priestia aryabhattai TaxID=412384 RepID=UPI00399FC7E8